MGEGWGRRSARRAWRSGQPRISSAAPARGQPGTSDHRWLCPLPCLILPRRSAAEAREPRPISDQLIPVSIRLQFASQSSTLSLGSRLLCFGSAGLRRRHQNLRGRLPRPLHRRALRHRHSRRRLPLFRHQRRRQHRHQHRRLHCRRLCRLRRLRLWFRTLRCIRLLCRRTRRPPRLRSLPSAPPPSPPHRRFHPSRSTIIRTPEENAEVRPRGSHSPIPADATSSESVPASVPECAPQMIGCGPLLCPILTRDLACPARPGSDIEELHQVTILECEVGR